MVSPVGGNRENQVNDQRSRQTHSLALAFGR
jgi:hypothetical protein